MTDMDSQAGTYFVDRIRTRCVEEGDCLLWQGAMASGYCPVLRIDGKTQPIRRWMWIELLGKQLAPKSAIVPRSGRRGDIKCDDRCIEPAHLKDGRFGVTLGTRRDRMHSFKMAALKQSQSNLTEADVEAIRAETIPLAEMSRKYCKSVRALQDIRSGHSWKPRLGPFAGLGERRA